MPDMVRPNRLTRSRPARALALAAVVSGVLVAACGGSSPTGAAKTTAGAGAGAGASRRASSTSTRSDANGSGPLAFAQCMRANGVPSFPDPGPGGNFQLNGSSGVNPGAPAFRAAQAKCQKLMGGGAVGGPLVLGAATHPSPQTLEKLVRIAQCMRQHGISQFPDPRTSIPSNPAAAGIREVTDFDGAILLFPTTMNIEAPAYRKALAACGAPPLGLPH